MTSSLPDPTVTEDVGRVAGTLLEGAIRSVLAERSRCLLAVPGGTTPEPVFCWLAQNLPAEISRRLDVIPVDERHLPGPAVVDGSTWPELHADSNLRLLWEHWIATADAPPTALALDAPGSLADALSSVLRTLSADPDVVLLGMGPDGHVASLFPGTPAATAPSAGSDRVLAVSDSPKPPPERLTFSLPALCAAHTVVVVARGSGKADAVRRCAAGDPSLPLTALRGPALHWVLDPAAASLLESP